MVVELEEKRCDVSLSQGSRLGNNDDGCSCNLNFQQCNRQPPPLSESIYYIIRYQSITTDMHITVRSFGFIIRHMRECTCPDLAKTTGAICPWSSCWYMPHKGTQSMCPNHRLSQIGDKKRAQFTAVQRSLNQNGRLHVTSSRNWSSPTKSHHPEMGIFTHRSWE